MKSAYKLFSIGGIEVRLHITLLVLFAMPFMELAGPDGLANFIYTSFFVLSLYSSVLVHELSHAFVALRNSITVRQITLWPLGGIASLGMVTDPVKEFKISIAGPLMSLGIGFSLLFAALAAAGPDVLVKTLVSGEFMETPSLLNFAVLVMYMNIILGFFNLLLPIFPMDGGRVLRSMLSMVASRRTATKLAVGIGQGFLVIFMGFAFMAGSLWLLFIGVFLFITGMSELRLSEMAAASEKIDLDCSIDKNIVALGPNLKIRKLAGIHVPKQGVYPVLDAGGKPVGVFDSSMIEEGAKTVKDAMAIEFPQVAHDADRESLMAEVYSNGYALITDKEGRFMGILTLANFQKALKDAKVK